MPYIFLSYARSDQTESSRVLPLVAALERAGYDVYYDVELLAGDSWADVLREKIERAGCGIVLWSERSVHSDWVREEASLAKEAGKLVPVFIDDVKPPFPTRHGRDTPLLARARFEDAKPRRRAHALARDRTGRYYYVDKGGSADLKRDFRFYRGLRGQRNQLSLQDVTQDSKGEIYTTSAGQLRLFRDPDEAQWIERNVTTRLDRLPVEDNLNLIYNELGVYLGMRFDVPCDDF